MTVFGGAELIPLLQLDNFHAISPNADSVKVGLRLMPDVFLMANFFFSENGLNKNLISNSLLALRPISLVESDEKKFREHEKVFLTNVKADHIL